MALWHFLAYFIFTSCLVAGQQTRYVLKGLEVNLNPGISKTPDNILWMHNDNKVVEFNSKEEDVYDPFTDRITLNWETAELSITNLGLQDTGVYALQAWVDKKLHTREFSLEVIDEVTKPTISCEMTDCSSSNMSATLVCAADAKQPQSSIKFEWSSSRNKQAGSKLTIPLGEKNDDEVYTCTVSNPLSVETATFTAKDCHSDCSSAAPIIIPIILVILLVLVGSASIMYCKRHRKACFAKSETGDLEKQSQSGEKEVSGSPAETEPLVNSKPEAADRHKGNTHSEPKSAEVHNKDSQDEKPQKGFVGKMKRFFESPGKSEDKPEETASPSPSQQSEATSSSDQRKLVRGEEGDSDSDQVGKEQTGNSQSVKEPDQTEVSVTSGENNPETSASLEQQSVNTTLSKLDSEGSEETNKHSGVEKNKDEETALSSSSKQSEPPPPSDQNNLSSSDKGDADADQDGKQQTEFSQSDNEADQPDVLSSSQDTKFYLGTFTSPEQPVSGSPAETEPLVNSKPEAADRHKGNTDSEPKSAEDSGKNKDEETALSSSSKQSEPPPPSDQNNLSSSDEGVSNAGKDGKQQTEFSHNDNEADQPDVLSSGQDTKSNVETSTSPEQPVSGSPAETEPLVISKPEAADRHKGDTDSEPNSAEVDGNKDSQDETPQRGHVEERIRFFGSQGTKPTPGRKSLKEIKKETNEDEEVKSPTDGVTPATPPSSTLTETSNDMTLGETADEHKEDDNSDKSGSAAGNESQGGGDIEDKYGKPDKLSSTLTAPGENDSSTIEESLEAAQNVKDQKMDAEKMEDSEESDENRDEEHKGNHEETAADQ